VAGVSDAPVEVHADVVIVGAGPTGLLSALLLADRGHRIALIERWPVPYALPRAVGISHETLRTLQRAGVIEEVRPLLLITADGSRVREIRSGDGELLATRYDRPTSESGWPERASFSQPELEKMLNARVVAHPCIQLYRGWTVTGVSTNDDGVVVEAERHGDGAGDAAVNLVACCRYVLGCDGANSTVLDPAWSDVTDLGFAYDWLVVDVVPHAPMTFTPHLGQILGPPRPTTLVAGGPGRRRWEFMRLPGETLDDLNQSDTAWRLLEPFGVRPDNATLERHAVYTFGGRWAKCWYHGHTIVAGDAAHLMPPFLGEGFNSGVRDALAISWQLDLVLRGVAPESLLSAYSSERSGHVSQIVHQAVELGRMICVIDPDEARERDDRLRAANADRSFATMAAASAWRLGPGNWLADDAHAGYPGIQGRVRTDAGIGLFDDLAGHRGFVLLGVGGDPGAYLAPDLRARWDEIGIVAHVGADAPIADVDGTYARWFAERGIQIAIFRPDHYVFGTSADLAESGMLAESLLDRIGVAR
jgi:2-polyprenyl-6-methoxyphenol hydroxylase-like FAD-dependent oxidoreductase